MRQTAHQNRTNRLLTHINQCLGQKPSELPTPSLVGQFARKVNAERLTKTHSITRDALRQTVTLLVNCREDELAIIPSSISKGYHNASE